MIAIDPGPEKSALVIWRQGELLLADEFQNNDLLEYLRSEQGQLAIAQKDVVVEMIASYGMAVGRETFETCLFIGRIQELCETIRRGSVKLVYRKEIKLHLCGTHRAKDANVRQALIDRLGAPGTKKAPGPTYGVTGHCWQALAVAVYAEDEL